MERTIRITSLHIAAFLALALALPCATGVCAQGSRDTRAFDPRSGDNGFWHPLTSDAAVFHIDRGADGRTGFAVNASGSLMATFAGYEDGPHSSRADSRIPAVGDNVLVPLSDQRLSLDSGFSIPFSALVQPIYRLADLDGIAAMVLPSPTLPWQQMSLKPDVDWKSGGPRLGFSLIRD